jgi:hypothetical protein
MPLSPLFNQQHVEFLQRHSAIYLMVEDERELEIFIYRLAARYIDEMGYTISTPNREWAVMSWEEEMGYEPERPRIFRNRLRIVRSILLLVDIY